MIDTTNKEFRMNHERRLRSRIDKNHPISSYDPYAILLNDSIQEKAAMH